MRPFTPEEQERIQKFRNWRFHAKKHGFKIQFHRSCGGFAFSVAQEVKATSHQNILVPSFAPGSTKGQLMSSGHNRIPRWDWHIIGYSDFWFPPSNK